MLGNWPEHGAFCHEGMKIMKLAGLSLVLDLGDGIVNGHENVNR
jgi:hypothetical protein